jgi:hypothetical protein
MMSTQERVNAALAILEAEQAQSDELPATVIMPPDSGDFIIGNPEGFVHLAIASLRAAKGEKQSFKDHSWWVNYELDWAIPGLKPDPSAHIYLPSKLTGFKLFLSNVWGYGAPLLAAVCLVVGLGTIIHWAMQIHF